MHKLVLIRHGESQWNKENRFTGWKDVDLTANGKHALVALLAAILGVAASVVLTGALHEDGLADIADLRTRIGMTSSAISDSYS